jgi:hypothetical protein
VAENKTKANPSSVTEFLNQVEEEQKRTDSYRILAIMQEITGKPPVMWGNSIVGFGTYHYKYASGREGDFLVTGFSPRKQNLSLYLMCDLSGEEALMKKLGTYKTGKSCLYIKRLSDIDESELSKLIVRSIQQLNSTYTSDVELP